MLASIISILNFNRFVLFFVFSVSNDSGKGSLTPSPRTSIGKLFCISTF